MVSTLNGQGVYRGTFPEVSNRADWITDIELVDDETDLPLDISLATFVVEVQDGLSQMLLATSQNGKVELLSDPGVFRFTFTAEEMSSLPEGPYQVGIRMTLGTVRYQLFVVNVPIIEGHITT